MAGPVGLQRPNRTTLGTGGILIQWTAPKPPSTTLNSRATSPPLRRGDRGDFDFMDRTEAALLHPAPPHTLRSELSAAAGKFSVAVDKLSAAADKLSAAAD